MTPPPTATVAAVRPGWGVDRGPERTVADAMVTGVRLSGRDTTVGELRTLFRDEHVHAAVIVEDGVLLAVVDRADVEGTAARDDDAALPLGRRRSRTVGPAVDLEQARHLMLAAGRRRLAVVGDDGRFRGLLCLKRTLRGFCSDRDVRARSDGRRTRSDPAATGMGPDSDHDH